MLIEKVAIANLFLNTSAMCDRKKAGRSPSLFERSLCAIAYTCLEV
ncbi:hypothetical protein [Cylindrospermum stagnale]|nr:hypothetical protein [Cylindrospermum stagnale]